MRSDRDIQRKPRRAAATTPSNDDSPARDSQAPVVVNAAVKVSYEIGRAHV